MWTAASNREKGPLQPSGRVGGGGKSDNGGDTARSVFTCSTGEGLDWSLLDITDTASVDVLSGDGDRDDSILWGRRRPALLLLKAISCSARL